MDVNISVDEQVYILLVISGGEFIFLVIGGILVTDLLVILVAFKGASD